jgi:UDP:flavonoid glycosyltransferase YjiC (YdhE family)
VSARIVYHALGGGHGHVVRGLAVLRRLGGGTVIGPARLAGWGAALRVRYVSPAGDDGAVWVAAQSPPDLLLADVFPRGVVGELMPWLGRAPAWLVARRVSPAYYLRADVRAVIESCFERVLWAEEPPEALRVLAVTQVRVPPVLLAPPVLPRAEARRRLGVDDDRALLLGLGSGEPAQQARMARLLARIAVRCGATLRFVSAELPAAPGVVRLFPAAAWLEAADAVVTAAGYHAFHETAAAGVPTVFVPQRRRVDDQWWRARDTLVAPDPPALAAAVRRLLREGRRERRRLEDGAAAVAALVQRRVQAGVLAQEQVAAMT